MSKRIFVVEDDEDIARNIVDLLEAEGYTVEHACDGKVALEKLRACRNLPDLILLDLMMPTMDGFRFRQEQESDPRFGAIPVVVMTADGHIEAKKQKIGAKAFVRKPIDIDTILGVVERFVAVN
ncbi:MAG: response regulator [Bdellovibrionota bacterium]